MSNSLSSAIRSPTLPQRKEAFVQLGRLLGLFAAKAEWPGHACGLTQDEFRSFDEAIRQAHIRNGWYTEEHVRHAAMGLSRMLEPKAMYNWLASYPDLDHDHLQRSIGIVMAGNIPFVGFHDLLCVLLSGNKAKAKVASDDAGLTAGLVALLACIAPELADEVELTMGKLSGMEAMIATGSDNTARYFEHYFGHLPHIIRKSRTSVAVLDGTETDEELAALSEDVFRYFGLGCRNVGKVFIPLSFDLDRLFKAFFPWKDIVNHNKYANNYDYNKAVWLLDRVPMLENGFLIMKEDRAFNSPVASLYYERYEDIARVEARFTEEADRLQCIVGHGHIPFGEGQFPKPDDHADKLDTLRFLLDLDHGSK